MAETGAQGAHTTEQSVLQALVENTQTHLAYLDPQFTLLYVNAAYARGSGYSQAELIGRNHFELFPNAENRAIFERVRDTGKPATFRAKPFAHPNRPDREITYWDWTLTPVQDDETGGEVQGLVLSLLDVSERERAVREREGLFEQLTTERARLDALIAHAPVGIMVTDAQARVVHVNPVAEQLYARPVPYGEAFDPLPTLEILHADGSPFEPQDYPITRSALQGETHRNVEMRIIWPDGRRRDLLISSAPIRDPQGEIDSAVAVFQDITERKRAEEALGEAERQYRELVQYAPAGIYEIDFRENRFTAVNDAICQMLGYSREELLAMNPFDITDEEGRALFRARIDQWLSGEAPERDVEYKVKTKGGRILDVVLDVTFTTDEEGNPLGATVVAHDVTERKRAQEKLRESETLYRTLAANLPDGAAFILDRDLRYVLAAGQALGPAGFTPAAFEGRTIWEALDAATAEQYEPFFRRALQGEPFEHEHANHGRHYVTKGVPIQNAEGVVTRVVVVSYDITARKEMEAALEESRRRLQAIFEQTQDAILLFDDRGRYVDANPAAVRLLGASRETLLQRELIEDLSEPHRRVAAEIWNRLLAEGAARGEYRLNAPGDSLTVVDYRATADVVPGLHLAVLRDITARVQMEEALREAYGALERGVQARTEELIQAGESLRSEVARRERTARALQDSQAMFESLFEVAPDGILLTDRDGQIVSANRAVESLFGYPRRELLGQPLETLLPPSSRERHSQHRANYFRQAQTRPMGLGMQLYGRRRDGTRFPVDVTLGPLPTEQGELVISIIHNVSKRIEAQEALRQSEARFRAVFENAPFGIALLDREGEFIAANPALQEILGYDRGTLQGQPLSAFLHPDASAGEDLADLIAEPDGRDAVENQFACRDNKVIWGQVSVSLVRDADDTPLFALCILEDVTEQRRTEAELAEVRRRLAAGREAERLLLAQELHDGPLQELHGAGFQVEMLMQKQPDEAARAQLEGMNATLQEVGRTLRAICQELRPSTLMPFGLAVAIRSHVESFTEKHPDVDVQLSLAPDEQALPESMRLALFRIYQQALSNVAQHAGAHEVRVRLQLDAEQIVLEIKDDGQGFQVPKRWVELARRGHLGLVGASERAETVGGRLEVISHPGDGTTLRVTAPRPPAAGEER